jgi:hypothetical protein
MVCSSCEEYTIEQLDLRCLLIGECRGTGLQSISKYRGTILDPQAIEPCMVDCDGTRDFKIGQNLVK